MSTAIDLLKTTTVPSRTRRLNGGEWRSAVSGLISHSFFVTPTWGKMLDGSGLGYRCHAVAFDLGDIEVLVPMATHRRFGFTVRESMPFGTYGGPLILRSERGADLAAAAERLSAVLAAGWSTGVFHATPGPYPHLELDGLMAEYETDILDLTCGPQALWAQLDKDARNQVRQAERASLEVRTDNSLRAFQDYYAMLQASSARWGLADPGKPWSLFASISRHATDESVRLWLAYADGKPAAGALCFYGAGEVFYWSGAMHEEQSRKRPNNLLQWRIIEDAAARGFTGYNMGSSGALTGVRRFKQQFGARPRAYPSYVIRGRVWQAGRALAKLPHRLTHR